MSLIRTARAAAVVTLALGSALLAPAAASIAAPAPLSASTVHIAVDAASDATPAETGDPGTADPGTVDPQNMIWD